MDRREVLKLSSGFLGIALAGGTISAVLGGCKADLAAKPQDLTLFDDTNYNLIVDICERILPATDTPGASDANVVSYIHDRIKNFMGEKERGKYLEDLKVFDERAMQAHAKSFLDLSDEQKNGILTKLFAEAEGKKGQIINRLREDTVTGFFTSEPGAMVLRYDPIPGAYNGCIPYKKGDKLWSY